MRSVIFSADKGRASYVDIRGKPDLHRARNHHGELAACARPFLLRIDGCGLWSSGDCGVVGVTQTNRHHLSVYGDSLFNINEKGGRVNR